MADRLYTSMQTDEYINGLRMETKLEKVTIAKMAFTYSLIKNGSQVENSSSFNGGEMKKTSFMGNDEVFIKTLIAQVYGRDDFEENELYSNKSIIKNHVEDGAKLLWKLFEKNGQNINRWYKELLEGITLSNARESFGKDLDIFIGKNIINSAFAPKS